MSLINAKGHTVGAHRAREGGLITEVLAKLAPEPHIASVEIVDEAVVMKMAFDMGISLTRVAGNVYVKKSDKDFWAVRDGKLVRLTGGISEVDNGESIQAADHSDPESSLYSIMADLEF
jgi:hypothetical protein